MKRMTYEKVTRDPMSLRCSSKGKCVSLNRQENHTTDFPTVNHESIIPQLVDKLHHLFASGCSTELRYQAPGQTRC